MKEDNTDKPVSSIDVISNFSILGAAIGVAIGMAGKEFTYAISQKVVMPLIANLFRIPDFETWQYKGIEYGSVISTAINLLLVVVIVILTFKFVLSPIVNKIIGDKKKEEDSKKDLLQTIVDNQEKQNYLLRFKNV